MKYEINVSYDFSKNAVEDYLKTWAKENDMKVTDTVKPCFAYSFLEKIYTERLYNSIGKHIWEWYD